MRSIVDEYRKVKKNGRSRAIKINNDETATYDEFLYNVLMNGSLGIRFTYVTEEYLKNSLRLCMTSKKYNKYEQLEETIYTRYLR